MTDDCKAPRAATKTGGRAANKADKLRRITDAARALFRERGFDGTTMRDISAQAGVGFGTLFDYAANKRDLLFLIFNPNLERVLDDAIPAAAEDVGVLDRLMTLFSGYYALYGSDLPVARAVLRELNFFSEGAEARKFLDHRMRFIAAVEGELRRGIAQGELRAVPLEPARAAVFAIYAWEVRRWVANDHPSLARGLLELRTALDLLIGGFRV